MHKLALLLFFITTLTWGQERLPFADEVAAVEKKYEAVPPSSKERVVFTGSSNVRLWKNIPELFPEHQIINTGFGGSQASDLLIHLNALVLKFNPDKVFIYEGDNDISAGKKSKEIISEIRYIINTLRAQNPSIEIVLIAAKPSLARWKYRRRYKKLNKQFEKLSANDAQLNFADVWQPMLNKRKVKKDIFIEDGLHMNAKGYAIWYDVIKKYIQ